MLQYIYAFNHSFTCRLTRSNLQLQNKFIIDLFLNSVTHSVSWSVTRDNITCFWQHERKTIYSTGCVSPHSHPSSRSYVCFQPTAFLPVRSEYEVIKQFFFGSVTSRENVCVDRDVSTPYRMPSSFLKFLSNCFRSPDTKIEGDAVGSGRVCDKWWQKTFGLRSVTAVTGVTGATDTTAGTKAVPLRKTHINRKWSILLHYYFHIIIGISAAAVPGSCEYDKEHSGPTHDRNVLYYLSVSRKSLFRRFTYYYTN
jgi:hypothetical protein